MLDVLGPEDGRPLVLSNALGTTSQLWDRQLPELAKRFRVVRYEHPPRSSVDELALELLRQTDTLGIDRFSLCGLSLGGMVGMWLGVYAPHRVDRLVLACTSARFGTPAEWDERAALVRANGMAAVASAALDRWFTRGFDDRDRFLRMQLEMSADDYARGLEAIGSFDLRGELSRIAAPTLVIAGAEDAATPPAYAELIAAAIPGARLIVVEGAAHLANVEQSVAFTSAVVEHLDG